MKHILSTEVPTVKLYQMLTAGVSPRPIALVSTIDEQGVPNLAPFSFFNVVGVNPPLVAFTPIRRMRDGTQKHTCKNMQTTKECVIQTVTYDIVEQVNIASAEFDAEIDEFMKSGLTPIESDLIKPFRVKESPFQMECVLHTYLELGGTNGSGDLIICKILKLHLAEEIFTNESIDPHLLNVVGRNGASYYTRAFGDSIFTVEKPKNNKCIGYDNLPDIIKLSNTYSANDVARFANTDTIPSKEAVLQFIHDHAKSHESYSQDDFEKTFTIFHKQSLYKNMLSHVLTKQVNYEKSQDMVIDNQLKIMFEKTAKTALNNNDFSFALNVAMYVTLL